MGYSVEIEYDGDARKAMKFADSPPLGPLL